MRLPARLLVITDRRRASRPLDQVVAAALRGGCRWMSVREKDLPDEEQIALLGAVRALGRRFGATVTLHGDPDLAHVAGADGVHLPAGGSPASARARLGDRALIGLSVHSADEAVDVDSAADYVTLSPIFPTTSKPGYGPALGTSCLADASARTRVPIVALGGVLENNLQACLAAGAGAVAVMGAVMVAADPAAATAALLRSIERPRS